jgi:hypothetical protein
MGDLNTGKTWISGEVVTPSKLNTIVDNATIKTGAVVTAKIADANVTTAKIADGAVTDQKVADGVVSRLAFADIIIFG